MTSEEIIRAIRLRLPVTAEVTSGGQVLTVKCDRITAYVLWIDRYNELRKSVDVIESKTKNIIRTNADNVELSEHTGGAK